MGGNMYRMQWRRESGKKQESVEAKSACAAQTDVQSPSRHHENCMCLSALRWVKHSFFHLGSNFRLSDVTDIISADHIY